MIEHGHHNWETYTLKQVVGFLKAIVRIEKEKKRDLALIVRAAMAEDKDFRKVYDLLK